MARTKKDTVVEQEQTLVETQADVGTENVTIDEVVSQAGDTTPVAEVVQNSKPVFEYVKVDSFLPVDITVGSQAYVRVLGPADTKDMVSTPARFTQPVIAITEEGFETDNAIYVEVK